MKRKFNEFNRLMFNGQLPELPIAVGRARTSLGGLHFERRRKLFGGVEMRNFHIRISSMYDLEEREFEDVLIHEMIHYHILHNRLKDTSAHGHLFRSMMNDINARYGRHISISYKPSNGVRKVDGKSRPLH
ncbi:MAG: SprT-like domain-containing protein [Prevotella sp.]